MTNPGPATVTGLEVSDDQGVTVGCPQTTIAPGETVVCTASDTAVGGQYANLGTATALLPLGGQVSASDPSHYLGQEPEEPPVSILEIPVLGLWGLLAAALSFWRWAGTGCGPGPEAGAPRAEWQEGAVRGASDGGDLATADRLLQGLEHYRDPPCRP